VSCDNAKICSGTPKREDFYMIKKTYLAAAIGIAVGFSGLPAQSAETSPSFL
jgi:hypothetical protein